MDPAWIPFLATLVTAILAIVPHVMSFFKERAQRRQRSESERVDDERETLEAVARAGAEVTKTAQALLPTMRERIKELESTLSGVKERLQHAEGELRELRTEYEQVQLDKGNLERDLNHYRRLLKDEKEMNRQLIENLRNSDRDLAKATDDYGGMQKVVWRLAEQLRDLGIEPDFGEDGQRFDPDHV